METCVTAIKVNVDIEQISSRAKEVGWSACRIRPGDYKDLVFGVPLQFHLAFTGRDVPLVVERTAQLVEEHGMFQKGIYRVPGQRTAILRLQAEFEANPNAQLYRPPEAAAWSPTPAGLVESPSQQVVEGGDMLGTSPGPAEAAEGLGSGADYAREAGSRTPSLKSASIQGSATSFLPLNIQDIDPRPVPRGDSSAATTPGSVPPSPAEKSTLTPTGYMDHLGQHRPFQPTDDIKNVAGLLKSFLVELPEPLFSVSPGERLANSRITDHQERLDDVCARLGTIPRCNKATLKFQLEHLHRVAANKQVNSMDEKNLGIVFTPGVFGDQPASQDILLEMKNDTMLAFMIENAPAILSRPPFEQTAS
ncbi:MAG: Rho GTPase activation protein [Olpidium bornovanus]|uniref:Rho GTPase activation protein n=1 Tax=Olpidium bornovanus TaxID=278681 RepID=A0A8H7ZTB0_9FUNG|nr:MAG: Rho GTPase activation protein [Olpidium bornovanus]